MEKLIAEAKQEGIKNIQVALIVEKNDKLLLLEPRNFGICRAFVFPQINVLPNETLQQSICKASLVSLNLSIKNIKRFLTYKDVKDDTRIFYFIVEVADPEDLLIREHKSFAWVEIKESFGYPIEENTREILDLYQRVL
jgi:hypothetical protein